VSRPDEQRPDPLQAIHERLLSAVGDLAASPAWRTMLAVAARFHTYSPNNVLLIASQRPDATRVAGYRAWTQLGRQVRKGEHGIAILAPVLRRPELASDASLPERDDEPERPRALVGFRVTHVFDISQTDGPELPQVRPTLLDGAAPLNLWADLLDQVEAAGYEFNYAELAPANGRTDFTSRTVLLDPDLSGAQKVKTLAHELAHIVLHAPDVRPEGLDRSRAEVEAESAAFVITAAHGISSEDYTVPYVTGWAGGNNELVSVTATRVLSCARTILHHAQPPGIESASLQADGQDRALVAPAAPVVEPRLRVVSR
jgi:antirestriction protein ArdC